MQGISNNKSKRIPEHMCYKGFKPNLEAEEGSIDPGGVTSENGFRFNPIHSLI